MPRIAKPLSDAEIKRAKKKDKTYKLSDGKGLYLVVKNNGTKFFRFDYTLFNKRKSMSFGIYPDVSLAEAREKREEARNNVSNGIDPAQVKNVDNSLENSFGNVSNQWLSKMKKEWSERNYKKIEGMLRNYTMDLQSYDIDKITRKQILDIINKLQSKNFIETAKRVLNNMERIFKFAVTYGYTDHNIIADIDKKDLLVKKKKTHFPAITDEEGIKQLMIDIKSYRDHYKADSSTVLALELAPYLFLRPYNIRFLEWDEVDLEKGIIDITGEKMKTGKDFIVPLPKQAIEILKTAYTISFHKSKYVFPSQISNAKPISENTLNHALFRLGYKDKMVAHGFRSMFSSIAHENINIHGHHSDVIELCLAHAEQNQVKAAYNRENKMKHFDERRELVQWYADFIDRLTNE